MPIQPVDIRRGPESLVDRSLGDILVTGGVKRQTFEIERQEEEDEDRKEKTKEFPPTREGPDLYI